MNVQCDVNIFNQKCYDLISQVSTSHRLLLIERRPLVSHFCSPPITSTLRTVHLAHGRVHTYSSSCVAGSMCGRARARQANTRKNVPSSSRRNVERGACCVYSVHNATNTCVCARHTSTNDIIWMHEPVPMSMTKASGRRDYPLPCPSLSIRFVALALRRYT